MKGKSASQEMRKTAREANDRMKVNIALNQVYEAERKKHEIQIFREKCESLGFSFIPSEEKLVELYLRCKNSGKEIGYSPIKEVDVYGTHPKCLIENGLHTPGKVGYFFTRSRPNEIQLSSDNVQRRWIFTEKGDVLSQGKKVGVKQVFELWEDDHCTRYKIIEYQRDPTPVDPELLQVDGNARLGSQGPDSVKSHPWFDGVDWKGIADCSFPVPNEIVSRIALYNHHTEDCSIPQFSPSRDVEEPSTSNMFEDW